MGEGGAGRRERRGLQLVCGRATLALSITYKVLSLIFSGGGGVVAMMKKSPRLFIYKLWPSNLLM